jgi:hypothetical protein
MKLIKVSLDLTATTKADMVRQLQDVIWDVKRLRGVPQYGKANEQTAEQGTIQPLLSWSPDHTGPNV